MASSAVAMPACAMGGGPRTSICLALLALLACVSTCGSLTHGDGTPADDRDSRPPKPSYAARASELKTEVPNRLASFSSAAPPRARALSRSLTHWGWCVCVCVCV